MPRVALQDPVDSTMLARIVTHDRAVRRSGLRCGCRSISSNRLRLRGRRGNPARGVSSARPPALARHRSAAGSGGGRPLAHAAAAMAGAASGARGRSRTARRGAGSCRSPHSRSRRPRPTCAPAPPAARLAIGGPITAPDELAGLQDSSTRAWRRTSIFSRCPRARGRTPVIASLKSVGAGASRRC